VNVGAKPDCAFCAAWPPFDHFSEDFTSAGQSSTTMPEGSHEESCTCGYEHGSQRLSADPSLEGGFGVLRLRFSFTDVSQGGIAHSLQVVGSASAGSRSCSLETSQDPACGVADGPLDVAGSVEHGVPHVVHFRWNPGCIGPAMTRTGPRTSAAARGCRHDKLLDTL